MDKKYAINLIKELFENPFSKEKFNFFIKNLLNHIEEDSFIYRGVYIPGIFQDELKTIERIGKYQDSNGKQLDILIITFLRDETLERARSLQRNIVAWYLNGGRGGKLKDAALVAFISPNNQDWRFSFVKMEYKYDAEAKKIKETYTPAKRYSYLVGPHEASHTAQSMMIPVILNDKINPTLEEIEAIFKIEKVTKEFFEKYKDLFFNLADQFTKNKEFQLKVVKEQGVPVSDFVKKLMGQIVFLYFLQKKGWLGVKQGKKWGSGDNRFMNNLFNKKYCDYKNFYNDVLEPLFYNTLNNRDRGNNNVINDQSFSPHFNCRIPYLNGGLFSPIYNWTESKIFIDNKYFQDIFDVFDTFNFTVFESDPVEKEVAVDPEMLGKVFENLLEVKDRKSKGTFYTPREIVHYMCQESLINYLVTQSGYTEDRIRKLMTTKDQEVARTEKDKERIENSQDLKAIAEIINELLVKVKICDPAVGSGAFPMGLLKEISSTRYFLNIHFLKKKNKDGKILSEYDIKKETLENCIYGVDLDQGAVEIARLRFWLALVVEHEIDEIEPLPNLEYKIMQGNSLIELLSPNLLAKTSDLNRNKIIDQFISAKSEYFNLSDVLAKSNKRDEINLLIRHIVNYDKEKKRENIWQKILGIRSQLNLFDDQKNENQLNIGDVTSEKISKELKELDKIEDVSNSEHFEWHLNFNEVFEKGGFDIVIGNPPYIKVQNLNKVEVEHYKKIYISANGKFDIYVLFIEKIFNILKDGGIGTYIQPHRFLVADYGRGIRQFLWNNKGLKKIINFEVSQIFESATTYTGVFFYSKENNNIDYSLANNSNLKDLKYIQINYSSLDDPDKWHFPKNKIESQILNKIKTPTDKLKNISEGIYQGIVTVGDDIFVMKGRIENDLFIGYSEALKKEIKIESILVKRLLKGENIRRYLQPSSNLFIFYPHFQDANKNTKPYEEEELLNKYPLSYSYISNFKQKLKEKKTKYKTNPKYWFSLHRSRDIKIFKQKKILTPQLQNSPHFTIDESQFYPDAGGYSIILKDKSNENYLFILGLLNSNVLWYFIKKTSTSFNNNYFYFKTNYLDSFGIPQLNNHEKKTLSQLVFEIIEHYRNNNINQISKLENLINNRIYEIFSLTTEEIQYIKNDLNS